MVNFISLEDQEVIEPAILISWDKGGTTFDRVDGGKT
jgi:hypothetical protein